MVYKPLVGIVVTPPGQNQTQAGEKLTFVLPDKVEEIRIDNLSAALQAAAIAACGVHRTDDPLNDTTFKTLDTSYIQPALAARRSAGEDLSKVTPIRQALIVFPPEIEPHRFKVLFNDEVEVLGRATLKYGRAEIGAELGLEDLFDISGLSFNGVRPDRDGFVWIHLERGSYAVYFNFLKCNPELTLDPDIERALNSVIENGMADEFFRGSLGNPFQAEPGLRDAMAKAGWFPAPCILPSPWDRMRTAFVEGRFTDVTAEAAAHLTPERLHNMLATWSTKEPFASDRPFFEIAISRYLANDFVSAVAVALPRIEGLINRTLLLNGLEAKSKLAKAFGAIEAAATGITKDRWIGQNLRDWYDRHLNEFFNAKFDPNDPNAPFQLGRHAHAHGATEAARYDREYATKVLLAIDTLFFILFR